MYTYEAIFVFRPEEETFARGKNLVKEELQRCNSNVLKEEDMGNRELAYPVRKETRGHYYLYEAEIDPQKLDDLGRSIRLMEPVMKHLFVRK